MIGKRGARTLGWLAASVSVLAACNAISGLDADYELAEGGTLPADDGGDGSSDSSARDGASADVSTDVTAPDASGTFRCPASPPTGQLFCDDFEVDVPWTRSEIVPTNGSSLSAEDKIGDGDSRGLRAHAAASSQSRKVARWHTVADALSVGTSIELAFRFKLNTADLGYFVLAAIQVNNHPSFGNAEYGLAVYKSCPGASPCLDDNNPQGEGNGHAFVGNVGYVIGQWYDAKVTVTRDAGGYKGTIMVDDKALDSNGETYFSGNPTKVEIGVGAFYSSAESGLTAEAVIDNVVVTQR